MSEIEVKEKDYVFNQNTFEIGQVTKVNMYFGWFRVLYPSGRRYDYRITDGTKQSIRILTEEQRADLLLQLETKGVTDYWYEE